MDFVKNKEVTLLVRKIVSALNLSYIKSDQIICFKSFRSSSRATARIWSLPRIWQIALKQKPYYCLEVLSEKFDNLNDEEKEKVIIHELLHIPKNFSGALLSHNHNGRRINRRVVEEIHKRYRNLK